MPEMDTRLKKFFKSDTDHIIPLVECPLTLERTIPRKTGLLLMLLWPPAPTRTRDSNGPFSPLLQMAKKPPEGKEGGNTTKAPPPRNCYFRVRRLRRSRSRMAPHLARGPSMPNEIGHNRADPRSAANPEG